MIQHPDSPALRRLALAVAVLDDVDLTPSDAGLVLPGCPDLLVSWAELADAVGAVDASTRTAQLRARRHLHGRRRLAELDAGTVSAAVRPVGYPTGHPLHPGPSWVRQRVLGGALDLGPGFVGLTGTGDDVVILPTHCDAAVDRAVGATWPAAEGYLEAMGAVRAERLLQRPDEPIRPTGDCDVVTLLGARSLRAALAARDRTGLAAVAVPMRNRGWLDLMRIDPAFAAAAAAATTVEDRGFPRPLLVTDDEVTMPPADRRAHHLVLLDDALPDPMVTWTHLTS